MFFSKFNINELYKEKWFVERLSTNRFVYSLREMSMIDISLFYAILNLGQFVTILTQPLCGQKTKLRR